MAQKQAPEKRFLQHFIRRKKSILCRQNDSGQILTETLILLIFMVGFFTLIGKRVKEQNQDLNQYHFSRGQHAPTKNFRN